MARLRRLILTLSLHLSFCFFSTLYLLRLHNDLLDLSLEKKKLYHTTIHLVLAFHNHFLYKLSDKGARIQVLDLPGIIEGAAGGRGRGRQVISTARTCNLILIVLDSAKPVTHKKIIEQELFSFGIRVNQEPPDIKFVKKEQGGIGYQEVVLQTKGMNADVARLVCKEYKISCAEIILREDVTVDQFIDVIEGNRAYIPVLYVFNKIDAITIEELDILDQMPVSEDGARAMRSQQATMTVAPEAG